MKNGLLLEDGVLVYYKKGELYHAGAIKHNGDIYYINSHGQAVKGEHIVHRSMANGLLKRGIYTFGDDCKLIEGSYIAPKKKKKKLKLSKLKTILNISVIVLMLALIYSGLRYIESTTVRETKTPTATVPNTTVQDATTPNTTVPNAEKIRIKLPSFTEEVLLCSSAAKQLYDGEISIQDAVAYGEPYLPFAFEYTLLDADGTLLLSENEDLSNAKEYALIHNQDKLVIDNLKTGTTYYYKVLVGSDSYLGSFTTAKSTRFISIPGATNTRDIGGYTTLDGKTVKQGMVIRGSEVDGLATKDNFVTEETLAVAQDTFGFVYDFDLRRDSTYIGNYISRFGDDVGHRFYYAPQYGEVFSDYFRSTLRDIFSTFADSENYPMYIHCNFGIDRTGTIIFLLQGVLNMSEEEMVREFQRANFDLNSYPEAESVYVIIAGLNQYDGDTIQEKIISFLTTDIGVTMDQIESIRNNLLTD